MLKIVFQSIYFKIKFKPNRRYKINKKNFKKIENTEYFDFDLSYNKITNIDPLSYILNSLPKNINSVEILINNNLLNNITSFNNVFYRYDTVILNLKNNKIYNFDILDQPKTNFFLI